MWMHKESKWLVRGGRKVRCYLCGKKILKKDLFMFHENTGYYSHQSCMMETGSMDRNERRRAVKKIAVGAAVVGAIAAGAGKFIGVSSQSSQSGDSPAAQTILTPQGLILPALTSDPANPLPGQMWYRSDAGVTAHFDAVQNRVVYSSEINDGNVHVTSKGIINGLSVLPNDGTGGFGPDTTKGATAPGQYGSPYTQTSGIQEATNYIQSQIITGSTNVGTPAIVMPKIKLSDGIFYVNSGINIPDLVTNGFAISGSDQMLTYVYFSSNDPVFTVSPDYSGQMTFKNIQFAVTTGYNADSVIKWKRTSTQKYGTLILKSINGSAGGWVNGLINVSNLNQVKCTDYETYGGGSGGTTQGTIANCNTVQFYNSSMYSPGYLYLNNVSSAFIIGGYVNAISLSGGTTVFMESLFINGIELTGTAEIFGSKLSTVYGDLINQPYFVYNSTTGTISDVVLVIRDFLLYNGSGNTASLDNGNISYSYVSVTPSINTADMSNFIVPVYNAPSTPSVPASGTAQQNTNPYPVDVYIYGGDVTEIQITRNGTAYTVLSVSTAIAMSGQAYKLNPGDSITVTYSTAPTWEWLSD